MDNSDRLKILAVRGLFTPKEPKTGPSKAPLKKPENMKDEEILPQQGTIFYRQQIPKILVWERWRAAQPTVKRSLQHDKPNDSCCCKTC